MGICVDRERKIFRKERRNSVASVAKYHFHVSDPSRTVERLQRLPSKTERKIRSCHKPLGSVIRLEKLSAEGTDSQNGEKNI